MYFRRGGDKVVYAEDDGQNEAYVSHIYLDGDHTSQLTLTKQQDPTNFLYVNNPGSHSLAYSETMMPYANTLPVQNSISGL